MTYFPKVLVVKAVRGRTDTDCGLKAAVDITEIVLDAVIERALSHPHYVEMIVWLGLVTDARRYLRARLAKGEKSDALVRKLDELHPLLGD